MNSGSIMASNRAMVLRYAGVIVITGSAAALTNLLRQWHVPGIFPSYFAAVLMASWIAGFGGGALSTLISTFAISYYWFVSPGFNVSFGLNRLFSLLIFVIVSLFAAALSTKVAAIDSLLSAALVSIQDAILVTDAQDRVTFLNALAERLTGWTAVAARKTPVSRVLQLTGGTPTKGALVLAVSDQAATLGDDVTLTSTNGGQFAVEGSLAPIRDRTGRRRGTIVVFRDVTESTKAEQELIQSRARLERSQTIAHLGSWERDVASGDLTWSDETYQIFGLRRQPVSLPRFIEAVHPQDRDKVRSAAQEALRTSKPYAVDHRIVRPDGSERTVREQAEVVIDPQSNRPVRLIGTVQDITEQRRLEEQLRHAQKMEAVGRFAGSIAHDFNNLLTVMIGYGAMLLEATTTASSDLHASANEIIQAAERAAELTRQLLVFSRRGKIFEPVTLNLNEIVSDMEKLLRRLLGEDVRLFVELSQNLRLVNADTGQLEQVIMNLAVNARDAMPSGGELTVETTNVQLDEAYSAEHVGVSSGNYVLLAVSDTGCGMTPETQARLFEPFFTTKEKGKGTGLGLATVYGIVKQSGGHIWVYSELGRGSTFKIYLPEATEVLRRALTEPPRHMATLSSKRILVVEDEDSVRKLTCRILEEHGHEVLAAGSAAEAMKLSPCASGDIHLLISDLVLPDMDGRELARKVRKLVPQVAVLFVSGYTEHIALHQQPLSAGAEFLEKPFTPTGLINKVQELFGQS